MFYVCLSVTGMLRRRYFGIGSKKVGVVVHTLYPIATHNMLNKRQYNYHKRHFDVIVA
jgi:hypothetical protein